MFKQGSNYICLILFILLRHESLSITFSVSFNERIYLKFPIELLLGGRGWRHPLPIKPPIATPRQLAELAGHKQQLLGRVMG